MFPITITQLRTLTAIHTLTQRKGYPPTREELAKELDCSYHNATYSVNCLIRAQALKATKDQRAITHPRGYVFIPIKGCPGGLAPKKRKMTDDR